MIDRKALLDDLKKLVTKLEKDLRERCEENAEVDARVRIEYEKAREAKRTAQAYKVWRDEWITQVAVAWVLGVVFVRFIEDNGLIAAPYIAGPGERLQFAKEQRTAFFQQNPTQSHREYLEHVFREVAKLPAMKELYDERHNPLWALGVSGDGAKLILEQFQKIDPGTGTLVHDFTDPEWETRFLGDLYQDLSEAARKKYALLQTPEFVEEFILDRTLDPAIAEFGLEAVRLIDPTCGSGHFLLGAFTRLFRLWEAREPATNRAVLAQRALDAVHGVDLNPYATAVSRFRLLLAAMRASGVKRLTDCPDFRINLATGDSLLHGAAGSGGATQSLFPFSPMAHVYETEDKERLEAILQVGRYHAVVGNPPYITVKDAALSQAYRDRFRSCHGKYSLAVPFFERFFNLARGGNGAAGFVGMITANSFMKREFGKKLIESCLPLWDVTHVIDTSGAYIPGHGTPTVILFGRNRPPAAETIRAVMGIKGEPSTPDDPASGKVWTAIRSQVDAPGSTSAFVSVVDSARDAFHGHPWSIGGGGAAELKERIEEVCETRLGNLAKAIGITAVTGEDDLYMLPDAATALRHRIEQTRPLVVGEEMRDWTVSASAESVWLYDADYELKPITELPQTARFLWPYRAAISKRKRFGTPMLERGLKWYEWQELYAEKLRTPLSIAFAFVATHNHFVLDRGGKVFKQSAPVIKLPAGATEDDHLALLGLLNSSTACFWMKQVSHNKGATSDTGVLQALPEKFRFEFDGTKLSRLPLPALSPQQRRRLVSLAAALDDRGGYLSSGFMPVIESGLSNLTQLENAVSEAMHERERIQREMVWLQEELDWLCYELYGISSDDSPAAAIETAGFRVGNLAPEERPFLGAAVPDTRSQLILSDPQIAVLEKPEYKRRWFRSAGAYDDSNLSDDVLLGRALREWLVNHLESPGYWASGTVQTASSLSHSVESVGEFQTIAGLLRGSSSFDLALLVAELVADGAVAALPADRYKESGLRNRAAWEETWAKQRHEDSIDTRTLHPKEHPGYLSPAAAAQTKRDEIGEIAVPPKYKPTDFKKATYWSLRGKLDVAKERFISFPGCERESDPSLPVLWAGLDHLQQARAIAAYYQDLKENEAAAPAKLGKLLACILELLPWLKQWHNDIDPEYGTRMGDFFESFMHAQMAVLGLTMEDLRRIRGL